MIPRCADAGADAADAVAEVHAITALVPCTGRFWTAKRRRRPAERHDLGATLHARPLLGQDELAAGEVLAGLGKQDRHLDREHEVAVEVLVEAVEVARNILKQEWCRPRLAGVVALLRGTRRGRRDNARRFPSPVPFVGHAGEPGIERRAQAPMRSGQRIFEVAVFTLAEAVPRHDGYGCGNGFHPDRAPQYVRHSSAERSFGKTAQP